MDFAEEDLQLIAKGVQKYINEGKSQNVISNLINFTPEQVNYIVEYKVNGKSSMIAACQSGNMEILKYLVEECHVQLEQIGLTRINGVFVEATPLWIAVKSKQNEIATYLIEKGANLNKSGSEPSLIHVACQDGDGLLVKFLIDHGADLNLPDQNGKRCIQKSLNKPEILRCLVHNGAEINFLCGKRPLVHTAIQQDCVEAVNILVEEGADIYSLDFDNTTALQFAAINFKVDMINNIVQRCDLPHKTIIETYELLGASAVENKAIEKACEIWWTSLEMQKQEPIEFPYNTDIIRSIVGGYPEPTSLEELHQIAVSCPERLNVRALIVRERFLGPYHTDNVFKLIVHGMEKSVQKSYEKSFQILQSAYTRMVERHGLLIKVEVYIITQIASVCSCIMQDYMAKRHGFMPVGHLFSLVMDVIDQLQEGCKLSKNDPDKFNEKYAIIYQDVMYVLVDILYLTYNMDQVTDNYAFTNAIHRMICLNPTGTDGNSLLHLALSRHPNARLHVEIPKLDHWHSVLSEMLLQNGVNPNIRNNDGETPLHIYLRHANDYCRPNTDIVNLLRFHGAHIDICDEYGVNLFTSAKLVGIKIDLVKDCTLMCLATHTLLRHKIPYENDLPTFLIEFVQMHICKRSKI